MLRMIRTLALPALVAAAMTSAARADLATFYVGRDIGATAGSNSGHLTLLLAHGSHFHRLSIAGGATGQIPESYVGGSMLLQQGTGVFDGRFVSSIYDDGTAPSEYSDLEIRSFTELLGQPSGSEEQILADSSAGRYQGSLAGIQLGLEVVSISSGLSVVDDRGNSLLSSIGDRFSLGMADSFSPFNMIFATDALIASGVDLAASFRLVDLNATDPSSTASGIFNYNFTTFAAPVPEPSTLVMSGLGVVGLIAAGRRRRVTR